MIRAQNKAQQVFLAVASMFLLFLLMNILSSSKGRDSVVAASLRDSSSDTSQSSHKLHLQDFHRMVVKNGSAEWEIVARDAKYFAAENVTQVSDSTVTVYRPGELPVIIKSNAAKILLDSESLKRADLEGNVRVNFEKGNWLRTEVAYYDADNRVIVAPQDVTIEGVGYEINGVGLRLNVDTNVMQLLDSVDSQFVPNAAEEGGADSGDGKGLLSSLKGLG